MAVFPDDIQDLSNLKEERKLPIIRDYITYMKERIEHWAKNSKKQQQTLETEVQTMGKVVGASKDAIELLAEDADKVKEKLATGIIIVPATRTVEVPANNAATFTYTIAIPDGYSLLTYVNFVATAANATGLMVSMRSVTGNRVVMAIRNSGTGVYSGDVVCNYILYRNKY